MKSEHKVNGCQRVRNVWHYSLPALAVIRRVACDGGGGVRRLPLVQSDLLRCDVQCLITALNRARVLRLRKHTEQDRLSLRCNVDTIEQPRREWKSPHLISILEHVLHVAALVQ